MKRNHTEFPADDDPQSGNQGTSNKGARNKAHLRNDDGAGGGKFKDTENDQSGDGHGGPLRPLR